MENIKKVSIRFQKRFLLTLWKYLLENNLERMAYLFCHSIEEGGVFIVLPEKIIVSDADGEVDQRRQAFVSMPIEMTNEIYRRFADSDYTVIINCHSHPFDKGDVWFSSIDDANDKIESSYIESEISNIRKLFDRRNPGKFMSIVFGQTSFAARWYDHDSNDFIDVDSITIIGDSITKVSFHTEDSLYTDDTQYHRQVIAFGEKAQNTYKTLTVAIVGLGGIGSIIAEGLCRIGCRKLILIDHDELSQSNLNRWQGGTPSDVGEKKVDICRKHLLEMFPDAKITAIPEGIYSKIAISKIKIADCIMGCLDNAPARFFLNRISLQYIIPYIDGGVVIQMSDSSKVASVKCRMAVIIPGITACMDCSNVVYYDKKEINDYFLDATTRKTVENAGYIEDVQEEPAPAVYPLNMSISSIMLFEFMNLFSGFKPLTHNIYIDWMNIKEGLFVVNNRDNHEGPSDTCLNCNAYHGLGDSESLSRFVNFTQAIEITEE